MIKQKIQDDQIAALKSGDKKKLETLRYILAKIKYIEIEKRQDLSDEEVVQVLRKQVKELDDSIMAFEKGNRADLVADNKIQKELIISYMPVELSDEELKQEIQKVIDSHREQYEKNPKTLIGICVKELKSKADPSRITRAFQSLS